MKATQDVLRVWHMFDDHPMETITKAWYFSRSGENKQRSVDLMKEHRNEFGTSGNCFDLALWLIEEFLANGITAYAVGHDLKTHNAHVAVVAINEEGSRYFCDLGDLWIEPILIDRDSDDYCEDELVGFVTGGKIKVEINLNEVNFNYIRPNGKVSNQRFSLQPIEFNELFDAANHSQSLLRHPLVEMRIYSPNEVSHWEFDRWNSFISSNSGLIQESRLSNNREWAARINSRTVINKDIIIKSLDVYSKILHN
ncbi:hypothetical protein AB6A23_12590 [Paenibacillus tarimensis]